MSGEVSGKGQRQKEWLGEGVKRDNLTGVGTVESTGAIAKKVAGSETEARPGS